MYGKIVKASKYFEPEMECYNNRTGKSDGYGPLENGFCCKCPLSLSRRLLSKKSYILEQLGAKFKYEIIIGLNGRFWINSNDSRTTIVIANILKNSNYLNKEQCDSMLEQILNSF